MKIAPKNSDTQLENVKSQFERNGTEQSQKKQKNGNANRNLFDLRFFAFSFLVARLMVNHHNHCQLLEKYFNRKLASLSLFLDSLAPAVYWLDMILNFHIGYDTNATQHWIGFRNRLNTNRHRYICIVTVENKRWIKHKWTREYHKNQSLKTTHTHTVFGAIFLSLSTFDFYFINLTTFIFVNLKIAKQKSVLYTGAKRSQWLVSYWYWHRGTENVHE